MIFLVLGIFSIFSLTDGACTFPTQLEGLWTSSHNGDMTFNSTHVDYPVGATGGNLIFECYDMTGTKYILKSEVFPLFSSFAMAVMCFDVSLLKTSLYQMNIYTSKLADANYQRVKYVTTSTTVTDAVACDDTANTEFHLLLKNGSLSDVTIQCPDVLLGSFALTFNETSCVNDTGALEVCTDNTLMTFNHTACSSKIAYSDDGNLNCIHSSAVGSAQRVHVYNLDSTTDESTYYRFTCLMLESSDGRVIGTQHPQDCLSTQTTSSVDSPGGTLNMTASVTCVPPTSDSSVATAAIVAGVLVTLVVLTVVGLIIGYFCWKAKCKKEKVEPRKGLPPTSTGDEDMVSDVSVISVGQESGENGGVSEQNNSKNHHLIENAFVHTDGILGQTRMVLAKQCQNKSLPCEIFENADKDILQSNQTKKSMVAKLISFFSFKKSDSTSNLLIKSNQKSTQQTESGSLVIVESGVLPGKKDASLDGNTPQHVEFLSEFSQPPKEATVTVKQEFKIDINISMTSAVTTTVKRETPLSKSNTSISSKGIDAEHSDKCYTETEGLNDTAITNPLCHKTETHISNLPPAEIHFCRDNKDKIIHDYPKTRSHCVVKAPSEHLLKLENHHSNDISDTALSDTQSNNVHIIRDKEVTKSLHGLKNSVSKNHGSTQLTLTGLSEVKENISKTTTESVHFDLDLESNTIKKTDSANYTVQRDNDENNVTDENASGMPRTNAIDNTTNSILNQKTPNDLLIAEKTEGTNKSNALARSEKITNNQSCFSSVSAKPSDKSLIIEPGSFLQTATCKTLSGTTDKANASQNQGHFTDNVFLSHRLLQNKVRVLDTSNYHTGNTSKEKSVVSGDCNPDETGKLLHLSANKTNIDRGNNPLDNRDQFDNTDGKVNLYTSDCRSFDNKESSYKNATSQTKSREMLPKPHLPHSVKGLFSQTDNNTSLGDVRNGIPITYHEDPLKTQKSDVSNVFDTKSSCIPNTMPPTSHSIGKTVLDMKSHNYTDETTNRLAYSYSCISSSNDPMSDSKSHESEIKPQHSNQSDLSEIKPNELRENDKLKTNGSLELRELKCDIPQRTSTLQTNIKHTNKKPLVSNTISANSDLLKQRKTPRSLKPVDLVKSEEQENDLQRHFENDNTKPEKTLEENARVIQPPEEENEDYTVSNFEFSESLDSSSDDEGIRVEEFSVDDTEDDTWSLATFAMPTKLEMDQKEEDIPLNYYKRKRNKKKSKEHIQQFYQNTKDKSQDINDIDLEKQVDLPFLNSHMKNMSTSLDDSNSKKEFDEKEKNIKTIYTNNAIDPTETSANIKREQTTIEDKINSSILQRQTDARDNGKAPKAKEQYRRNIENITNMALEQGKSKQLPEKSMECNTWDSLDQNTVELADNDSCKLNSTCSVKALKDNIPQNVEGSNCITLNNGEKSQTLPEINFKERSDVSFVSLPGGNFQQNVKQDNKTTKMSSLLSKAESMSLPRVDVKKAFTVVSELGTKLKSKQHQKVSPTKETKSKTSSLNVEKTPVKKKSKKTKTTKFSRNITFKVNNEPKPVVENYDKFGEKEEKLRDEKPNKFRFDQLPTIRRSKSKEKPKATKKAQKCSTKADEDMDKSEMLHEELKLPDVGGNELSEKPPDGTYKPMKKDHVVLGGDQGEGKLLQAAEKKVPSQKKVKKKRKKKKKRVQQTKGFSSEIDSDDDIEIDPSVYFTARAGNSSRPASSHELPQLINKIKLTASCTDIRSLCGDID